MSLADNIFIDMCCDIVENDISTEGEKVCPHWEDGTLAYTIKKFGVVNYYDLSKEFLAMTLRRTAIKSAIDAIQKVRTILCSMVEQFGRKFKLFTKFLNQSVING